MKTIILHFEWKLCGILTIFEVFSSENTTHLIRDLYLHCDVEITLYNPIKNLQDNYKKILDDGLFTDCVLKVGDEEIKAHRCILVQNNVVFKSMLADNGMLESQNVFFFFENLNKYFCF
ncbi:BTB domain-containing protein [Meloidogyne graminicola]|uniref:BTB domain-containing protein n=1 Tax=Meloidogyne graminicola TaxID=189291 RepID=A0A8S9ZYW7_9BILA|nr:BTB domain-containing protein [Meloidogyne graminicola]